MTIGFLSLATGLFITTVPLAASTFKAGFAERDITPAIGMEEPGGYGKVFHQKFHDPCKVRAAVVVNGTNRVAIVGLDALIVPRSLALAARKKIEIRCGIPAASILISASHSHSSGPIGMVQPGQYDAASPFVRELAAQKSSTANPDYLARVEAELVNAVCAAIEASVAARAGYGVGREETVSFNRRGRMRNGTAISHPGKGNPDLLGYAGPIDPDVGVIGFWAADGKLIGCVVNFACHATTNPGGISANWIYYLEQTVRGAFGEGATVIFLQGASGDITQVDNLSPYADPPAERWARLVGGRVGAETVKVLLGMETEDDPTVASLSRTWKVPRRRPDPERVREAREKIQKEKESSAAWIFAKELLLLQALIEIEPEVEVEVQGLQLGPVLLLSNPAELFCEYGRELKARSGFPITFPVELANGCVGYVPTEEAFGANGGGYETRLTSYSNLEITAGRQFVDAGLDLARKLIPRQVPTRPPHAPFKEPWSYGNVRPEIK